MVSASLTNKPALRISNRSVGVMIPIVTVPTAAPASAFSPRDAVRDSVGRRARITIAERAGFEPTEHHCSPGSQPGTIDYSVIAPRHRCLAAASLH